MARFGISFPEFFRKHTVIQDSIFDLIELFFLMFENLVNCLLRSPGSLIIPFIKGSLLFVLFLLYFSFSICVQSQHFFFHCEALSCKGGLVGYFPSSERFIYHIILKLDAV